MSFFKFKYYNKNKGITLVALVVTIVVLIILAGVSISLVLGQNGIINKAKKAQEDTIKAQVLEEMRLKILDVQTAKNGTATIQDALDFFNSDTDNDYAISLSPTASIVGTIPDISSADEIYVIYKSFEFKIDKVLSVSLVGETESVESSYFITYDANGGTNTPEVQQINYNGTITNKEPVKDNCIFIGWSSNKDSTSVEYVPNQKYTNRNSITLYALWMQKIDYLESDGFKYIDTGFKANQNTHVEMVASSNEAVNKTAWFGCRNNTGTETDNSFALWNIDGNFRSDFNTKISLMSSFNIDTTTKYTIDKNKNVTTINGTKYCEEESSDFSSNSTLSLFGIKTFEKTMYNNNDSIDYRMANIKLYSCKVWDNDTLIRDFVPIKDINNTYCLYDLVTKKIYNFIDTSVQPIEYIESTGNQYIDTGYVANQDTSIEFTAESNDTGVSAWFGARQSTGYQVIDNSFSLWDINNNFRSDYYKAIPAITDLTIEPNKKYTVSKKKNVTSVNGVQYQNVDYTDFTTLSTLTLFGLKTNTETELNAADSVDSRMAKIKLYSCKIWDKDNLIFDFIPAKDFNNKICLYDKVNRSYYYSANGNDFIYDK